MNSPHPSLSFHFFFPYAVFLWLNVAFNSIWHWGSVTYCKFTQQNSCLLGKNLSRHRSVVVFLFCRIKIQGSLLLLLPPLVVKFSCCTQCCTGRSEEALFSSAASKHFSLGGRVTGSLWHGLFVRGFGE